jgi:exopolyphosphatase / guanosine-5'-triphosphate,3'-diphosphate pyrophosphatase
MAMKKIRLAAADIGSNNMHLTIAEVDDGELKVLTREEIPTRLSADVDDDGRVSPEKMAQIAAILNLFQAIAESFEVQKFLCIATEATRASNNADQFIDFLCERTGVDVQVVSRELEAALTFRGATYNRKLHVGQLVADIGGGSTELIASNRHQVDWMMTIPIGSGRMTDRFIRHDPPRKQELGKLRAYLERIFQQVRPDHKLDNVIFTGGTTQNLHHLIARDQARWKLKRKDLDAALKRLRKHPSSEMGRLYQMDLARAATLAAGIVIAQTVLCRFNLKELRISPQGVRSGLILTYAQYGDEWNKHLVSPDIVHAPSPLDKASES